MSNPDYIAPLNEVSLKCLFLEHLRGLRTVDQNSIIASEYALGRVGRRIDLAIWNGEFIGVEFKSKFDSLRRLSWQLQAYLQCFDRVIVVIDQRHSQKVTEMLPAPVELWTVDSLGNLTQAQAAGVNRSQSAQALANLCSLAQLRRLAPVSNNDGVYRGRLNISASELRTEDVYEAAIEAFKRTFVHSSRAFWNEVADKKIDPDRMLALSRFSDLRTRRALMQQDEQIFWQKWAQEASDSLLPLPSLLA
ncbi:sce7726 family protein [Bradyrhizobium icense]|uniref:Sce7726 family protein n=1 Tax=Bradyrhizobium icense TaxID=1274631 RepID=A0A1B1ULX6_9BRAD|nr:sce7726 family protein [Bradyrhizobium icense]ANW03801.1 hypothetical protein LMTR13_30320 [Bradyrhizobium icense]